MVSITGVARQTGGPTAAAPRENESTSKINPDLVIQADELNTPSETLTFTTLTCTTSTTTVNTSPITTNIVPIFKSDVEVKSPIRKTIQNQHLLKYVRQKDDIIIVGCGNSTVGMNLYDANYRSIVSIDISPVAIKQMKELNKVKRPDLVFQQMDATKLEYNNEKFSVVIDKGTFDEFMTDSKEETVALVTKYIEEIKSVLKSNGRYICISLLQEHILKTVITNLSQSCAIRIIRCHDVESKALDQNESSIPVFMVVATKFSKLHAPVRLNDEYNFEYLNDNKDGRKKLLEATKYDGLMIVTLNRGQKYESIEAINSELHKTIVKFAPANERRKSLGGGALCMFIRQYVPHVNLLTVEIDKAILDVAKSYFDFIEDDKSKVRIADAKKINQQVKAKSAISDELIDIESIETELSLE
ncbi:hypothetical protein TKK_0013842 [Trichogramma kaykai]